MTAYKESVKNTYALRIYHLSHVTGEAGGERTGVMIDVTRVEHPR